MMTNDEIRDRIDDYQRQIKEYGYLVVYDSIWMTNIIETLLARQAEALSQCPKDSTCCAGMCRLFRIRDILYPQPAALAEEKKNG